MNVKKMGKSNQPFSVHKSVNDCNPFQLGSSSSIRQMSPPTPALPEQVPGGCTDCDIGYLQYQFKRQLLRARPGLILIRFTADIHNTGEW